MTRPIAAALTILAASPALADPDRAAVVATYADIGAATYADAATAGDRLKAAVHRLIDAPSAQALADARAAWISARVPYQQSEAFRFGNPIVDDWEGRVNSWPLDEGLIDYVDAESVPGGDNDLATLDIIANPKALVGGREVDASVITAALLEDTLQEADGIEANVATGYHAVEFLLWGQDLHGTGPGAGERPWTDYALGDACTHGNCDRRAQYLGTVTDLLASDLAWMAAQWQPGGAARTPLEADPDAGVAAILTGIGSLSYGELAGQRMKLGLMLNDPEEEHDCFSDNSHNSFYYDGVGMRNVWQGSYERIDGSVVAGPSLASLVAAADPATAAALSGDIDASVAALMRVKSAAEAGMAYDQMIARGNAPGAALVTGAVDALVAQARDVSRAVTALGLDGSALDATGSDAVFQ